MRIITEDNITTVSANSEDASYPASNVLNSHPKKAWKAASGVHQALLEINFTGTLTDVGIIGTNAKSIDVVAAETEVLSWERDGAAMTWDKGASAFTWEAPESYVLFGSLVDTDTGNIWLDVTDVSDDLRFKLLLTTEVGETLYVGVVSAGAHTSYPDPQLGSMNEELVDYSVKKITSNGSVYYRKRSIARKYSFSVRMCRNTDAVDFMRKIGVIIGQSPLMWRITDLDHSQWIIYGGATMSQSHEQIDHNIVQVEIMEAI